MATTLMEINTIAGIVAIAAGIFLVEEVSSAVIRRVVKRAGAGPTVLRDISGVLRVLAAVLVVSNVLGFAGLSSLTTTLTVSGIVAISISLALQTTLSNVISGLLLFSDGLVKLDDEVEYSGTTGKIVRIGLRNTWIRTQKGQFAVVSNSTLMGGPLVNHTATDRLSKKYGFQQPPPTA